MFVQYPTCNLPLEYGLIAKAEPSYVRTITTHRHDIPFEMMGLRTLHADSATLCSSRGGSSATRRLLSFAQVRIQLDLLPALSQRPVTEARHIRMHFGLAVLQMHSWGVSWTL